MVDMIPALKDKFGVFDFHLNSPLDEISFPHPILAVSSLRNSSF